MNRIGTKTRIFLCQRLETCLFFSTINHLISLFFMLFLSHFVHEIAFQFCIRSLVYNFQAVSKRLAVSSLPVATIFNLHMAISCEEIESFKNDENFFFLLFRLRRRHFSKTFNHYLPNSVSLFLSRSCSCLPTTMLFYTIWCRQQISPVN